MRGYCLIHVENGRHDDVVNAIKAENLPPVKEVHKVAGTYDVVVELMGDDPRELGKVVLEVLQRIDGIVSTVTLLAYSSEFIEWIENARAGVLPDNCPVGMDTGSSQ